MTMNKQMPKDNFELWAAVFFAAMVFLAVLMMKT